MPRKRSVYRATGPRDPRRFLIDLAACRAPALVLSTESKAVASAEFAALTDDSITFHLFAEPDNLFTVASLCCVSFVYRDSSYVFLAAVLGYMAAELPVPSTLILAVPSQLADAEGHIRYRVPVPKESGLQVRIATGDGQGWSPKPVNLSLTGILVEFSRVDVPALAIGAEAEVNLQLDNENLTIQGEVLRQDDCRYGIFFREALREGCISPPEALRSIVRVLERRWLRRRVR